MKTKNILILASLLIYVFSLTSCNDQLSALPTQEKVEDNLIVDSKSAEVALNGIFYMYAQCTTDNYSILSTGCTDLQEIYPADFAGTVVFYQGKYVFEDHAQRSTSYYVSNIWSSLYSTLSAANGVLEQMNKADDAWFVDNRKAEIMAEEKLMRALCHYNLLRWFAQYWDYSSKYGVLLRTESTKAGTVNKDRSTVKDSYDQILGDIDEAIANCPTNSDNYYVCKWVAKGLKARVLMMRGQGSDYADAAVLCKDIIDNGPYTLEDNLEDIFHSKGLDSKEVMFGIKPKDGQSNVFESYYYRSSAQYWPTDKFLALFDGDPRKDWLFDSEVTTDYHGNTVTATTICKHMKKSSKVASTLEETQYQMRLTEMYLLRAEALVLSGGDMVEAKTLLKTIMGHAGLTDFTAVDNASTKEALLKQIFNETLKNMFCESGRELEIMMRMPKSIVTEFNPAYSIDNTNILPIPADEFKYNKLLQEQNPGYTKE